MPLTAPAASADLFKVVKARSACELTATAPLPLLAARAEQEAWHLLRVGPAVIVPAALIAPGTSGAPLRPVLYRHLPFTLTQPGGVPGTVYLVCFDTPYKHARHYLGFSQHLDERLVAHEAGTGSRLMRVIVAAGISWALTRTWPGADRYFERQLKLRRATPRACPRCHPGNNRGIPEGNES